MSRQKIIEQKIRENFSIEKLEVIDESEMHRGHSGFQEGGESHFRIRLISADFEGQSRLARHRSLYEAIGKQLLNDIHALALELDIPS